MKLDIMGKQPTYFSMVRFRRHAYIALTLSVFFITWIYHFPSTDRTEALLQPAKSIYNSVKPMTSSKFEDLTHLENYDLTPQFGYAQRIIKTKHFSATREELTVLNKTKLFDELQTLSAAPDDLKSVALKSKLSPLTLSVPTSPKVDTSIMSFGIASNLERLPDAIPQLQHWLPFTQSTLRILVPPSDKIKQEQQHMRDLGIKATIQSTNLPFASAYFSLVKELYDTRTSKTKWLVLIDDDTFIPSLPTLIAHLNKAYDPSEELLLAAMSDNIDQIRVFGLLPFGGGGIFISVPLAAKLTDSKVWQVCMDNPVDQGDQMIDRCLRGFSRVRPTFDSGLNQMDFRGDSNVMAGIFESGRQMLSIHHWRSWFDVDMPVLSYVSKACGDEGILMRWLFEDNIVLSNGYSIAEYPNGIQQSEFEMVEHTWAGEKWKALHKIGPLRDRVSKEDKKTLRMAGAEIFEGYGVRQTYIERVPRVDKTETRNVRPETSGFDRVVELIWLY